MSRQAETIDRVLAAALDDVHTCLPGRVRSYDRTTQTATIRLGARRVVRAADEDADEDTSEALPDLVDVPVLWPGGGGFYVHLPLAEGDSVLVLFPETSIDRWLETGSAEDPSIATRHGLDGAIAIPGLRYRAQRVAGLPADALVVGRDGGPEIRITAAEVRAGGSESLAIGADVRAHLQAIATTLASLSGSASFGTPYNYGATLGAAPIDTTTTKGS